MALFAAWTVLIAAALAGYCVLLWRKNRARFRFKARLTIVFLLLVLVPVIPLNLFVAHLLTRSADVLLLPGVGSALETSLATLRLHTEERGNRFLGAHPDPRTWTPPLLRREGVLAAGVYRSLGDSVKADALVRLPECPMPGSWKPPPGLFVDAGPGKTASLIHALEGLTVITVCRTGPSGAWHTVCYPVPEHTLRAKNEVSRAFEVYNTLNLLKESIIQKNIVWALAVLFILGLAVLSVQVAKKLSNDITEPMHRLVQGMHRVAAGDFSTRINETSMDEFGFLVNSFNRMAEDLRTTKEHLIRAEKLAAWQEVARQISHEMKNSLTPVSIAVRRLRRQEVENGEANRSEPLRTIEEELRGLERMASNFSEFARLPEPNRLLLDLNETIRSAVRLSEPAYGAVEIRTRLAHDLPEWAADAEQIRRLLNNLLKNAAEAARTHGWIEVRTAYEPSPVPCIVLEVSDNGEGMDEETLQKALTPYFTTKQRGTGLGLAIVEKIAKDHDGELALKSEKGKGTTVCIRFRAG